MPEANYRLAVAFPDQSPGFAHGFTCGRIWQQMKDGLPIDETVLAETRPCIEAMAMAEGWVEGFSDVGDGWLRLKMMPPHRERDL